MEFVEERHKILQRPTQPVYRPRGDHIKPPPCRVLHHAGEGRTLISALRTTDAVVFIDLDGFSAAAFDHRVQLQPLVIGYLLCGRDTKVRRMSALEKLYGRYNVSYRHTTIEVNKNRDY